MNAKDNARAVQATCVVCGLEWLVEIKGAAKKFLARPVCPVCRAWSRYQKVATEWED